MNTTGTTDTISLAGPLTGIDEDARCISCGHLPGCPCPEDCISQAEAGAVEAAVIEEPWEREFVRAAILMSAMDVLAGEPLPAEGRDR
jgi:hypothetical protein